MLITIVITDAIVTRYGRNCFTFCCFNLIRFFLSNMLMLLKSSMAKATATERISAIP